MAIKYLAGNRLWGTNAERLALTTDSGYGIFNGSDQSLTSPSVSNFKFMSDGSPYSLAFWVYRNGSQSGTEPSYMGSNGTSTSDIGWALYCHNGSDGLGWFISNGSAKLPPSELRTTLSDTTWTHIAVTYSTGDDYVRLYKDGTSVATYDASGYSFSTSDPAYITAIGKNIGRGTHINARMADIGFWEDHVLSTDDITKLAGGSPITDDGAGFDYSSANIVNHLPLSTNDDDTKGSLSFTDNGTVTYGTTGTPLDPSALPLLPNGALFEESDTGKHYMWDGSSTWNEVA